MRKSIVWLAVSWLAACSGGDGPATVAEAFWEASQNGDHETAETYVAEGGNASMGGGDGPDISEFTLGATETDGDSAAVETSLTGDFGEEPLVVDFRTIMVRQEGEWKVDLDGTANEMMRAIIGMSMDEMGQVMGEAMGEAMKGAAQGMAEGMREGLQAAEDSLEQREP